MEKGYYWVMFKDGKEWVPAYCHGGTNGIYPWSVIGSDNCFDDSDFSKIGPEIEVPEISAWR